MAWANMAHALRSHLAASEGCYKVTEWLIEQGSDVNALDRFKRTPLEVHRPETLPFHACWQLFCKKGASSDC